MIIKRICGDFDSEKEIPVAFCGTFENLHSFELKTVLDQKISYSEFSMAFKKDEILFDEKEKIFFLSESDEETMQDEFLICAQAYGEDSIYLQSISEPEKIIGGGTLRRNNGKYILSVQKLFQGRFDEYASKLAVLHGRPHLCIIKKLIIMNHSIFRKHILALMHLKFQDLEMLHLIFKRESADGNKKIIQEKENVFWKKNMSCLYMVMLLSNIIILGIF